MLHQDFSTICRYSSAHSGLRSCSPLARNHHCLHSPRLHSACFSPHLGAPVVFVRHPCGHLLGLPILACQFLGAAAGALRMIWPYTSAEDVVWSLTCWLQSRPPHWFSNVIVMHILSLWLVDQEFKIRGAYRSPSFVCRLRHLWATQGDRWHSLGKIRLGARSALEAFLV